MARAAASALAPDAHITALTATTGLPYIAAGPRRSSPGRPCWRRSPPINSGHDAAVIAAYGDPGLVAARELFDLPVVGMAEAAMLTACQLGARFAVVTFAPALLPWYEDAVALAGCRRVAPASTRCAGRSRP